MRKSSIAIVALIGGLVAIYLFGRPDEAPPPEVPRAAQHEAETPPVRAAAPHRARAAQPFPQASRPSALSEEDKRALKTWTDDRPAARTEAPVASPPQEAPPPAPLPHIDRAPAPAPVKRGPVARPQAPAGAPTVVVPAATGASIVEPAAGEGAADGLADDGESDRLAPVLESLRFDPPEIKDGGISILSVGATDELSGIKIVSGTLKSPSEAAVVFFAAHDAAGSGVFTTALTIPPRAETGDWFVGTLQVIDKADNALSLTFAKQTVPQGGSLRVVSEESDSSAPTLRGISVEHGSVAPGERNRIVAEVEDVSSGVASVSGTFQNRARSALIPFTCRANGEVIWEADVAVPENADCGEWALRHLILTDNARNAVVLNADDPQFARASFLVSGGGSCDAEPPVLDGMYVSPPVVSNTAAVEVILTVRIHDEGSGVATVFGRIEGPRSADGQVARIPFECAPDPGDPEAQMTAKILVPQYAARGVWSVIWLHASDKARNARPYYKHDSALAGGTFTVN